MITKDQFIKIADCSIDTHLRDLFGDIEDEYGEYYSEVYKSELGNMYEDIGNFLNTIANKEDFVITLEQLVGVLLYRWNYTFDIEDVNIKTFERIANSILIKTNRALGILIIFKEANI